MTRLLTRPVLPVLPLLLLCSRPVAGQEPPTPSPPPPWTASAGAGLALTSGNSDTSTFNANYAIAYDPQRRNIVKSDGLYIRGKSAGELSADRLSLNVRDEFRMSQHAYVFGQHQYLRDAFKDIEYLLAPTAGIGIKLVATDPTMLSLDAGVGGVWEKNPGVEVRASGAVTMDEKLSQKVSSTAVVTQSVAALWKTEDLSDALFQFGAGISVAVSARTQLKVEGLSTYKNKPPSPEIQKNDVSVVIAFVIKN